MLEPRFPSKPELPGSEPAQQHAGLQAVREQVPVPHVPVKCTCYHCLGAVAALPYLPRGLRQPPGQGLQGVDGADAQIRVGGVPDSRRGSRHNIQEPAQQPESSFAAFLRTVPKIDGIPKSKVPVDSMG